MMERDYKLFEEFAYEMYQEYMKHYPNKGDSWKDFAPEGLTTLLLASVEKPTYGELREDPKHFLDIANYAMFCYYRFKEKFKE